MSSGGSGTYTYSWTSPGFIYPQTACIDVNPSATTTYTCVASGMVSAPVSADITVLVSPAPVVTSPLSVDICSGTS